MDIGAIISRYRAWILSIFLALCGLIIYFILEPIDGSFGGASYSYLRDNPEAKDSIEVPLRTAFSTFFFFGGLAIAFSLEPLRWKWSLLFGLVAGLTIASISYWASSGSTYYLYNNFHFASGILALAIATPLFQNIRDNGTWKFEYERLHFHSWTDVVIYFASLLFTLLSWLLFFALASLFELIGIDFLENLMGEGYFTWTYLPASFGAALSVLRDNERILGTLQNVVLIILSILAPPFAFALIMFLAALLFNGFETLWDATDSASVLLIICAAWSVIFANAIIRNNDEQTSPSKILQYSAIALGCVILPLAAIASISAGLRIGQYGLTPERIWGFIIIIIACAYGLAYVVNIVMHRFNWAQHIRSANIKLAIGLCGLALFLALPILNFNSISANNQMSRYDDGITDDESFDYAAMAFDFGPKGREILRQKSKGASKFFKEQAQKTLQADNKWDFRNDKLTTISKKEKIRGNLLLIDNAKITENDIVELARRDFCLKKKCASIRENESMVLIVESAIKQNDGTIDEGRICRINHRNDERGCYYKGRNDQIFNSIDQIAVKDVARRQIFIGGKAVGDVFE